jgi:hypothetical protein
MAVGDQAQAAIRSYIAYGKESTFGTYASVSVAVEAISCSFKVEKESMKLETLNKARDFSKRVQTNQNVTGNLETYLHPIESILLYATAMGGGISTSSQSGVSIHTITAGNFDTSPASVCFNIRKGTAHVWEYSGGRPSVVTLAAEVGEPIKMSVEMVFKDATLGTNDIGTALSVSTIAPFVYHQGQYIYAAGTSSLTTTNAEPIQSFELVIDNGIISDAPARQLGSQLPSVLPATQRDIQLTIGQRWDTTTNYSRFMQATEGAIRLEFTGSAVTSTSALTYKWQIDMPKVLMNSPDPELSGAGDLLQSEITFDVITSNPQTTTGYAIVTTIQSNVLSANL